MSKRKVRPTVRQAKRRAASTFDVPITAGNRKALYGAQRVLDRDLEEKFKVRVPFDVYFQDPDVARETPSLAFDTSMVPWEPGLGDGPTSARFAVVDYDSHTGTLTPPAVWDADRDQFTTPDGTPVTRDAVDAPQFHQVNVWALVQRALDVFESSLGLGRRVSWGFEGSRLIVVPHAGVGENAYYDRTSHSLQFYYFDRPEGRVHTCLSTDIVNHEFGHAVLDGIRPLYIESVLPETAAFHEFVGDITAILIALQHKGFRDHLADATGGDLSRESTLSRLAEQFGKAVKGRPYLRSARNPLTMAKVKNDHRPHHMSQVLTGAMFDILIELSRHYMRDRGTRKARTVLESFAHTIQRMQMVAIQPLDLLPPVDVTFRDYALAVLRSDEVANPTDPDDYRGVMLDAFVARKILTSQDREDWQRRRHVFERLDLDVFHDIASIAASPADAYRFLDDNRAALLIPRLADVVVTDLSAANKRTREARRLPRQVLLQYVWREDVALEGAQFGRFEGQTASLLCGGTLALNQNGEVVAWARKPGAQSVGSDERAMDELAQGTARHAAFLEALARRVRSGSIGSSIGSPVGLVGGYIPPLTARTVDSTVRFELSPHFSIHDDVHAPEGGRQWQISS